jgi:hypothetical protein
VNKLRLLRKLNDDELFGCLSGEGLRLFLLMIAGSAETGEGEIHLSQIVWILGKDFSPKQLEKICEELQKKQLVCLTYRPDQDIRQHGLAVMYRILPSG